MSEDLSVQILSQTSDNIQKLFDLSTRIDERVKSIQSKQENLDDRIDTIMESHNELMRTVAVLNSSTNPEGGGATSPSGTTWNRCLPIQPVIALRCLAQLIRCRRPGCSEIRCRRKFE